MSDLGSKDYHTWNMDILTRVEASVHKTETGLDKLNTKTETGLDKLNKRVEKLNEVVNDTNINVSRNFVPMGTFWRMIGIILVLVLGSYSYSTLIYNALHSTP